VIKNVICIHEEDAGILWKHTDYRPGGRSQTVRSRRLVVSMVCTLANYGEDKATIHYSITYNYLMVEYIWNYYFYQDGNIELEMRLSGILQVYCADNDEPNAFGTTVAPNTNAHYHQHIFSIRVDPMIDGLNNSVVEMDVVPIPEGTGSVGNFAGNGFTVEERVLKHQSEGAREYKFDRERRWKMVNPARKHYSSGRDVGYIVGMKEASTRLMAKEEGWVGRRAGFAKKALWVIKDVEDSKGSRMWPSGKYVPQTREEPEDSVGQWLKTDSLIENEDVLVYITVGTTHIPRPEDWPVMPVEHLRLAFKPNNFFRENPSMDVPGIKDSHSGLAFPNENAS